MHGGAASGPAGGRRAAGGRQRARANRKGCKECGGSSICVHDRRAGACSRLSEEAADTEDPGLTDARGGPQMLGWGDLHVAVYLVRIRVTSLCIQAPSRRTLMAHRAR